MAKKKVQLKKAPSVKQAKKVSARKTVDSRRIVVVPDDIVARNATSIRTASSLCQRIIQRCKVPRLHVVKKTVCRITCIKVGPNDIVARNAQGFRAFTRKNIDVAFQGIINRGPSRPVINIAVVLVGCVPIGSNDDVARDARRPTADLQTWVFHIRGIERFVGGAVIKMALLGFRWAGVACPGRRSGSRLRF